MTEWTTIRVRQDAKDAAAERKPDGMTWSEFVAAEEYDPDVAAGLTYDDVKAACAAAVRGELPEVPGR